MVLIYQSYFNLKFFEINTMHAHVNYHCRGYFYVQFYLFFRSWWSGTHISGKDLCNRSWLPSVYLIGSFYIVLGCRQLTMKQKFQVNSQGIHVYPCTHVSILLQTPLPSKLPHNIEQSSMC